jgi:hypothetical protein
MTVPTHFKFTFRGVFQSTPEIWSFGVKFARNVDQGPDAGLSDINQSAVTDALRDYFAFSGAGVSGFVLAKDWRCYVIGTNGRMEGDPLVVDVSGEGIQGAGTNRYPPQVALAITTVAPERGPARFGRWFLPGPTQGLGTDLRLTVTDAQAYGEAGAAFLKDISAAIDLPGTIASAAAVHASPGGGGTLQAIDHVEVGRVLDTIRTRRNSMLEAREIRAHIDW